MKQFDQQIRVQKYLMLAGIGSRRECEDLVKQGRVEVNDKIVGVGHLVRIGKDVVRLDGEKVKYHKPRHYLVLYKPKGYICTRSDPKGRKTVYSLLPEDLPKNVQCVGRLDLQSEGLLIFTDDGELASFLTRPTTGVEKEYQVKIQGKISMNVVSRLVKGVKIGGYTAKASSCHILRETKTNTWLKVVLVEGKNREIRRMFEALGRFVLKIKRIRIGIVKIGKMKVGEIRRLTQREIDWFRDAMHRRIRDGDDRRKRGGGDGGGFSET